MATEDITTRRHEVEKIISHLKKNNKKVNRYTVHEILVTKGYNTHISTVYRDITAVNRENTWVRDLSESNYSTYMEDIYNSLEWAETQAVEQYNKTWTANKIVKKQTNEGDTTETTTTQELGAPKNAFLSTFIKANELKHKMLTGDNINISAALLGKKLNELKKQVEPLQEGEEPINLLEIAKKNK